jgi:succinoglycan biosynthesis protein ExoW
MIAVVIPYFQRSPGILTKALHSIATQKGTTLPIHVLVIDDASPVSAQSEIQKLGPLNFSMQVVVQPNGGPGAARNKALDLIPAQTRYVAFLDSDDEWTPNHLARAQAALEAGFDFYFADHFQLDQNIGAFARAGRLRIQDHPALPLGLDGLHAYRGDMLDQVIRGNLIGTSTVVFRWAPFASQRFRPEFTNAGEDYIFWMEMSHQGARVAFSTECEARYGRGVNVYSGTAWGSQQHLLRVHNEMRYRKFTAEKFPVSDDQRLHLHNAIRLLRREFVQDVLHMLKHRVKLPLRLLIRHLRMDPLTYFQLPLISWQLLKEKKAN